MIVLDHHATDWPLSSLLVAGSVANTIISRGFLRCSTALHRWLGQTVQFMANGVCGLFPALGR